MGGVQTYGALTLWPQPAGGARMVCVRIERNYGDNEDDDEDCDADDDGDNYDDDDVDDQNDDDGDDVLIERRKV
eukprot:2722212-Lingulodinium_polyedra.AAC.1